MDKFKHDPSEYEITDRANATHYLVVSRWLDGDVFYNGVMNRESLKMERFTSIENLFSARSLHQHTNMNITFYRKIVSSKRAGLEKRASKMRHELGMLDHEIAGLD